jgi:hypothetical protein
MSRYRIVVRGELRGSLASAFEGMWLTAGSGVTTLEGEVVDQVHLHGLLDRMGELGLEIVSVEAVKTRAGG